MYYLRHRNKKITSQLIERDTIEYRSIKDADIGNNNTHLIKDKLKIKT